MATRVWTLTVFTLTLNVLIASCTLLPELPADTGPAPTIETPTAPLPVKSGPGVFAVRPADLIALKAKVKTGDPEIASALTKLRQDANSALRAGPYSVVGKTVAPPSGDKHDYFSLSRYWWPNPASPDGLPYVNRDGQVNPEINSVPDHANLDKLVSAVEALSLEYYLEGDDKYADRAAILLRAWFLDEPTRMNPNLNAAQVVRGRNNGSSGGIIDARGLSRVIDSVGLLAGSSGWTDADQTALRQWFVRYLDWLTSSNSGKAEARATNNHGTWYDVQAASIALFVGNRDLAVSLLQNTRDKRIPAQIEPDGRQPAELARETSWNYSVFNLEAFTLASAIADNAGIDLWDYQTSDGRSIRKAFDYLVPFVLTDQAWKDAQIAARDMTTTFIVFRRAAIQYNDDHYRAVGLKAGGAASSREHLLYPER